MVLGFVLWYSARPVGSNYTSMLSIQVVTLPTVLFRKGANAPSLIGVMVVQPFVVKLWTSHACGLAFTINRKVVNSNFFFKNQNVVWGFPVELHKKDCKSDNF